jgi:uncharacterized protein with HEPN domain
MRHDRLYLDDITEAAEAIASFLTDVSEETFLASDLLQSAVLQKLMIIGEAAARLSPELKANAPNIPWSQIVAFRNIAVHAYFSVQWPVVWIAATEEASLLRTQILDLLAAEEDASETSSNLS